MHFRTIQIFTKILLIFGLFNNTPIFAQEFDQNTFAEKILLTYQSENIDQLKSLIQNHRLMVKPFIDDQLEQSVKAEFQNNEALANQKLKLSKRVAEIFAEIHQENSLNFAVKYISEWDKDKKKKKLLADSLYESGTKLRGKSETLDKAFEEYQQALQLFKEIGDQRGEGITLGGLGFIYWYKKDPEKALSYFKQALQIRTIVDDKQLIGNSFNDIGFSVCWYYLKDYDRALENLLQSAKIRKEIGDLNNYGKTLSRIGRTYEDMGQMEDAYIYYSQATEEFQSIEDKGRSINALYDCSIVLAKLGRYPEALDCLEKALPISKEIKNQKKQGNILNKMGIISKSLGDYESALNTYQRMLTLMQNMENQQGIARAKINIGVVLRNLNRLEKASLQFNEALEIFTSLDDKEGILDALSNLGLIYLDSKEYQKGVNVFTEALRISRELHNKTIETNNLINLGTAYNFQSKSDTALIYYQEALSNAENLKNPLLVWATYLGMGDNYERKLDYQKAIDHYNKALNTIEQMHGVLQSMSYKASFLADQRYVYEAVIHLLDQLYQKDNNKQHAELAFKYAEQGKARAFLDLMAESLAKVREGADPELLQRQEELLSQISTNQNQIQNALSSGSADDSTLIKLKKETENLENEYSQIKQTIHEKNPKYAQLQYPQPATVQAIQSNLLNKNTILLEYILGDSSSSLWVITDKDLNLFNLPNRQKLTNQVDMLLYAMQNQTNKNAKIFTKSSNKLYNTIIGPAKELIKKGKQLIIIPDGVLNYLPFETLITKIGDNDFQKLHYLIKNNPISYAPSASVLMSIISSKSQKHKLYQKELLAFGDPFYGENEILSIQNILGTRSEEDIQRGNLLRLKYSGEEVKTIAGLFPQQKTKIFLRQEVSEEKIKGLSDLDQYRYIHFATHGLINEKKPDFSCLALGQPQTSKQDGFLQAAEIFNLRLNTDLVVLSACETGLGKMVRGEGMIGLTRAFMYAGTPSVTVSLWSVSDKSTSELMKNFYINLIKKNTSKAEALRQAKIDLIKDKQLAHPFYWAPFILIGDWQ